MKLIGMPQILLAQALVSPVGSCTSPVSVWWEIKQSENTPVIRGFFMSKGKALSPGRIFLDPCIESALQISSLNVPSIIAQLPVLVSATRPVAFLNPIDAGSGI